MFSLRIVFLNGDVLLTRGRLWLVDAPWAIYIRTVDGHLRSFFNVAQVFQGRGEL